MSEDEKIAALAAHFKAWGAKDAELWAASEVKEGIPQYARYVFLRKAWEAIVTEGDTSWIDASLAEAERYPDIPCAGAGHALKRMLALGASREDIIDLVRTMQFSAVFSLCYQMADPGAVTYPDKKVPRVEWALVQLNEHGLPSGEIGGLHESLLGLDPTGREMRPRS